MKEQANRRSRPHERILAGLAGLCLLAAAAGAAVAGEGGGAKNKAGSPPQGFSGRNWTSDYEIGTGRCDRDAVAAVLRGTAGEQQVALLLGGTSGTSLGARVGRLMDDTDFACIAQALEVGRLKRPVAWANPVSGARFQLTLLRDVRRKELACREFSLRAYAGGRSDFGQARACLIGDEWQITKQ